MSRRNNNNTDPRQLDRMRKKYIADCTKELAYTQHAIEALQTNDPLQWDSQRAFLLDMLYCKLHKLQKRYDTLKGLLEH